jgi:uncharacterized protein YndB with AHSA1/START domain
MTKIRNEVLIRRARGEVFDLLSDPRSELQWNPKVERMDKLDDGPIAVGSHFHAKWKLSKELTLTITHYERPRGWAYTNDGPIVVDLTIELQEDPDGTLLSSTFDAKPKGLAWLFFPVFLIAIRREEKQNMAHLKQWLEASVPRI